MYTTIGGGYQNSVAGSFSTVGGGYLKRAALLGDTVAGGQNNLATNNYSTVGGGLQNRAEALFATVAGGSGNRASGQASAVPGGENNVASGRGSFAAGQNASATNNGVFVWGDAIATLTNSTNNNSVTFRSRGGYRMFTDGAGIGAYLAPSSGTWTSMSDRNAKEAFAPVEPRAVLDKVAALAVQTWRYKGQDTSVRHI